MITKKICKDPLGSARSLYSLQINAMSMHVLFENSFFPLISALSNEPSARRGGYRLVRQRAGRAWLLFDMMCTLDMHIMDFQKFDASIEFDVHCP